MAERSIAADCKSAAHVATEVRTLPSPPFDSALRASLMASQARAEANGVLSGRWDESESKGLLCLLGATLRVARAARRAARERSRRTLGYAGRAKSSKSNRRRELKASQTRASQAKQVNEGYAGLPAGAGEWASEAKRRAA